MKAFTISNNLIFLHGFYNLKLIIQSAIFLLIQLLYELQAISRIQSIQMFL